MTEPEEGREKRSLSLSDKKSFLTKALFDWFNPKDRVSTRAHMLRGFTKSFLVYFVPITLFRRKITVQNVRRSLALGVFVAGVRAVDAILKSIKEQKGSEDTEVELFVKKYSLGIAAFVSALVGVIIDGEAQYSVTLTIWALVRSFRPFLPDVRHGPIITMCISAAQILSTWITNPEEHNPMYLRFLNHHGGKNPLQMKLLQLAPEKSCDIIHPGTTCTKHFFHFLFVESLPRSLKVYIPVFLVAALFSKRKSITHTVVAIMRSSLFLSSYCAIAWLSSCLYPFDNPPYLIRLRLILHTWMAGFAALLETPSRRSELAAYCTTYAIETIFHFFEKRGYITVYPAINQFILAISAGILLHHPEQQPQLLMRWLFRLGHP